jgi:hypothetical protein
MRRPAVLPTLLLWPGLALGAVLNVEFRFAPYTGDPKDDQVETVAGTAHVSFNGVPFADEEVRKDEVPVMFDGREVASPIRIPVASMGPVLRKGRNTIRIEFEPKDASAAYKAQLRWASVTDQTREKDDGGRRTSTNQTDEGVESKDAKGKVVFERQFTADFAKDLPWHHQPPVTSVTDAEKEQIAAFVEERADWFEPDFAKVYEALGRQSRIPVGDVKKDRCLDAAYEAGVRVVAAPLDELEIVTTGQPEVVVRGKSGQIYGGEGAAFEKIKDEKLQMCAGMALGVVYPSRLAVIRTAAGGWDVAY